MGYKQGQRMQLWNRCWRIHDDDEKQEKEEEKVDDDDDDDKYSNSNVCSLHGGYAKLHVNMNNVS